MKKITTLIIIVLIANIAIASEKIAVSRWLSAGPLTTNLPAFSDVPNVEGEEFSVKELLSFEHLEVGNLYPEKNMDFYWDENQNAIWAEVLSNSDACILIEPNETEKPQFVYLAAYIKAERWLSTKLEITSPNMLAAYFDGEKIGEKTTTEIEESKTAKVSQKLELAKGTHLLLIKTLYHNEMNSDTLPNWKLSASFEIDKPYLVSDITTSLVPDNIKNINHVMDGVKVTGIQLSPDAKYYAVNYRRSLPPSDSSESWTEIKQLSDKKLIHSFRNAGISGLKWLPKTNSLSYISKRNGKSTLFLHDIENNRQQILIEDIENFSGYHWSPDESYLVYSVKEDAEKEDTDVKLMLGMRDRIPGYRDRNFLYKYDVNTKVKTRLTHGNLTSSLLDISPDGESLLLSHARYNYEEEPYWKQDLYLLDINNLSIDTLFYGNNWSVSVSFSPDGKKLLAVGGASAFDGLGENIPEGLIPNNYDMQMYIINLEDKSVKPITKNFDPSVLSADWSHADNKIYLSVAEKDYRKLYSYDVKKESFKLIETNLDIVGGFNLSSQSANAVYTGNLTSKPPKSYHINLKNKKYAVIEDTESENYKYVNFGQTHDWDFTSEEGVEITGRVYLPPDFDENAKYPVIVYYYGGTSPVTRSFGGRYPFNLWAGNGYIVYVLQPSGSVGFGQEFSAAHVNNWGITVADEIIEGTEKFLIAHPYADADKVGCIGASYGGFMTMLLVTRTDIFSAAISHAGISSISSYWGEGYWGYSYSAVASSGSFPWNNPDLYIGQSPLFHADKVETPLLLLSGDSDTNVPPGESIQMYTALTLLGKPVELVLIKGQDHHIIKYSKRIKWHNTIMAWWDMMLKEQPEYWNNLFPEKNY
ncbi:MAG: prolyl oligopeptidase family serine peptidase [Bacteroidota bacterium]